MLPFNAHKNSYGFTVIEILIILVIVAIIAIPVVGRIFSDAANRNSNTPGNREDEDRK